MIVELLLGLVYDLLDFLLWFELPQIPEEVHFYFDYANEYIKAAASFVNVFAPLDYLLTLLGVIIAVDVGISVYHLVLWILKKIPMLGIE